MILYLSTSRYVPGCTEYVLRFKIPDAFEHLLILLMNYLVYLRQSSVEAALDPILCFLLTKHQATEYSCQGLAAYGPTAIAGWQETASSHPPRLAVSLVHNVLHCLTLALSDTCKWQVLHQQTQILLFPIIS